VISITPHDLTTEAGRSRERYRRAALTSAATVAGKGFGFVATLISVPLTVDYLGVERYGIWVTISSIVAVLGFADMGFGNGLLNAISAAHGRDDREFAKSCVSAGFFMLCGLGAVLGAAFAAAYPFIPWGRVFNVAANVGVAEAGPAMAVFWACYLIGLPLSVVSRVQMGYQQGFMNAAWQAAGSCLTLACLLTAIWWRASLPMLVAALAGAPLLATVFNGMRLFGWEKPWLLPQPSAVTLTAIRRIAGTGVLFLILQLAVAMMTSIDNLIVAQYAGPQAVTALAVPARLFVVATGIVYVALTPLWPAYGEAIARGDVTWVRRTVIRSSATAALLTVVIVTPLVFWGKPIIQAWVGEAVDPSLPLLMGLGCWAVLSAVGTSLAMFMNAANVVGFQVVTAIAVGLASVALKVSVIGEYGNAGVIWSSCVAYTLLSFLPGLLIVPLILRNLCARPAAASPL